MHKITFTLLAIGGINWLLWGLFEWEVGHWLGGMSSTPSKILYIVVGIAAIIEIAIHKSNCRHCNPSGQKAMPQSSNQGM